MTRPERMFHVTFLIDPENRQDMMRQLQESGVCQIDMSLQDHVAPDVLGTLDKRLADLEKELDINSSGPRSSSSHSSTISLSTIDKDVSSIEKRYADLAAEKQKLTTSLADLQERKRALVSLPELPLGMLNGSHAYDSTVRILQKDEYRSLSDKLDPSSHLILATRIGKDELVAVELHDKDKESVLSGLAQAKHLDIPDLEGRTSEELKRCTAEIKSRTAKLKRINKRIAQLSRRHNKTILSYHDIIKDAIDHARATRQFDKNAYYASCSVWVAESSYDMFIELLFSTQYSPLLFSVERDDAPIKLNNNAYATSYEEITKLYSLPNYKGFDPTIIIAIFFPLIFGIMYSDAIYGLLMALVAVYLHRKYGSTMRSYVTIISSCAVLTIIMGILTGSYFGNLFETIGIDIPSALSLMTDIIPLVVISISIGIIHISTGLFAGFNERIRTGRIKQAISEQGVWIVFLIGAILAFTVPASLSISLGMMIISLLVKAVFVYEEQGTVSAILSIFDVSKLAGDIASYVRIMALAIGTAGIALAVNIMAGIALDHMPVAGIVFAVLIFIVGHAFNMLISGLGASIHTLRLHFLEHFSRYYVGDGDEYKPFSTRSSIRLQQE
ncbi:MAG: V-type ATP synthase subunit I [Nanoarchaeota archaeon]